MKKVVLMALAILSVGTSLAIAGQAEYDACRAGKDPQCKGGADHCCAGKHL